MIHPHLVRPGRLGLVAVVIAAGMMTGPAIRPASGDPPVRQAARSRHVPPRVEEPIRLTLEGGTGWINTAGPIHAEDLRGKVVILDFWTFCCINCHHVLPDLAYLENKYRNELVVIGVHTPKFTAEQDTENLRKKVAEYRIKHPVINDAHQAIWKHYGVESWPTIAVFDTKGHAVYARGGEGQREILDEVVARVVKEAKAAKELDTRPFVVRAESEKPHDSPLNYPGKIFADAAGKRLFISDTGNNRIVVTDLSGKHVQTIGTGAEGKVDGPFDKATFNRPQGLTLVGEILYVADTESHAIRAVDLREKTVSTVAGTGEQGDRRRGGGPAKTIALNSPWDVILLPGTKSLAIAMAGPHQIWKLDLADGEVSVWAGNGRENIQDGSLASAEFAQPSGLATDGEHLFVADSETSSIRTIGLKGANKGRVGRIVGQGLFEYADVDGRGPDVRLQHCLGVAFGDGKLYIADTYNNKIKVCDPAARSVKTLAGTRDAGIKDNPALFDEPGGISLIGSTLYIADTNNHAIRALDVHTGKAKTLPLDGVTAPPAPKSPPKFPRAVTIEVPEAKVVPGKEIPVEVSLTIPSGYKLNPDAPFVYLVETPDSPEALVEGTASTGVKVDPPKESFTIPVPLAKSASAGDSMKVKVSLSVFICKKGSAGFCTVNNFVWTIPVTFADDGASKVAVTNATEK